MTPYNSQSVNNKQTHHFGGPACLLGKEKLPTTNTLTVDFSYVAELDNGSGLNVVYGEDIAEKV